MKAYVYRSGQIKFGNKAPKGALVIADHPDERKLRKIVSVLARHGYDNKTLFVPGIPEAANDEAALNALVQFQTYVTNKLAGKKAFISVIVSKPLPTS